LEGHANEYIAANGERFTAQREFLLSLDIDFRQFNFKRKWVQRVCSVFDLIKVPLPALQLRGNEWRWYPVYF
jgi:hypothetical protein